MVQVSFSIASRKVLASAARIGKSIKAISMVFVAAVALSMSASAEQTSDLKAIVLGHYPLLTEQDVALQSIREALNVLEQPFELKGEASGNDEGESVARLEEALSNSRLALTKEGSNIGGQLVELAVEGVGERVSRFDLSLKGAIKGGSFHESLKYHLKERFKFNFNKNISVNKPDSFQLVYGFYALILLFSALLLKKALFR